MTSKKQSMFSRIVQALKPALINFLRKKAVKVALKKILGATAAGGIYGWIIAYVVEELYDEVAKPIIQLAFRKVGYLYEVKQGEHVLRKIQQADNVDDWIDSIDDA